jgi:prophage antirepressor-like protein
MSDEKCQVAKWDFNGREVRTVQKENEPWWLLRDACDCIGIGNSSDAASRLDDDEKGVAQIDTLGGKQNVAIINESGLYNLILRSDKPEAKVFKKWITSEVLPSIRKHGMYATPDTMEKLINDPQFGIRLLQEIQNERKLREAALAQVQEQDKTIMQLLPKADYTDTVLLSDGLVKMNDIATHLRISAVRLNKFLSMHEVIYKQGGTWYPHAKFREGKFFDFHVFPYVNSKGETKTSSLLKATEKGRQFVIELWEKLNQPAMVMA